MYDLLYMQWVCLIFTIKEANYSEAFCISRKAKLLFYILLLQMSEFAIQF